ncbi:MAG: hypothetical protein AABM41_08105 [Chloroflexota bacterium]
MAQNISELKHPAPGPARLAELEATFAELGAGFQAPLADRRLVANDQRQEFAHFWAYSALAAPFVGLANVVGWHPNYGFAVLNVGLLAVAFIVVSRFVSAAVAALLVLSPVLWWVDKAHPEVFTVALLLLAFALVRGHPGWALVAIALASTQNLPIAAGVPLLAAAAVLMEPTRLRDRGFWLGLAASVAIAAIHPVYYLIRLGVYTSQAAIGGVVTTLPSPAHVAAVVVDPNIGLVPNFSLLFPILIVFVLPQAIWQGKKLLQPDVGAAALLAVLFLVVFTQTPNLNSGATPSLSRYGLWLIPLLLPLFTHIHNRWRPVLRYGFVVTVLLSAFASAVVYRPSVNEDHLHPTGLAQILWNHAPNVDNPPLEIFLERTAHTEIHPFPVATESCSKVLVVSGKWPDQCGESPSIPAACRFEGAACYANRAGTEYEFVPAP